jgi:hypothetical protein
MGQPRKPKVLTYTLHCPRDNFFLKTSRSMAPWGKKNALVKQPPEAPNYQYTTDNLLKRDHNQPSTATPFKFQEWGQWKKFPNNSFLNCHTTVADNRHSKNCAACDNNVITWLHHCITKTNIVMLLINPLSQVEQLLSLDADWHI